MPDPQTPNLQLYIPLRGADVDTWDVPMNANFSALDAALGQVSNIAVAAANITLSSGQYATGTLIFTGVQTADITVTFPALGRFYNILNNCTGNTNFVIKLQVAANVICAPPGRMVMVYNDTVNLNYVNLPPDVGFECPTIFPTLPRWIGQCTVQPFLNMDGATFSSSTYPALAAYLGTTTLPDSKGRFRATLGQGSGRLTGSSSLGGVDGTTIYSGGGDQTFAVGNLPNYFLSVTDPGHVHFEPRGSAVLANAALGSDFTAVTVSVPNYTATIPNHVTGITVASLGSGNSYAPPAYVGGLNLIRAG